MEMFVPIDNVNIDGPYHFFIKEAVFFGKYYLKETAQTLDSLK